nr:metalloproteinase [Darna trima granulovirus]
MLFINVTASLRVKRFLINRGTYWPQPHNITYSLFTKNIPSYLNIDDIRYETNLSFNVWQSAVAYDSHINILKFYSVRDNERAANIKIMFARGDHGDMHNFDGPGNVLAHTFAPPNGQIHFDADENWLTRKKSGNGIYYMTTLVHEIGHAIGLFHSSVVDSIMYPMYSVDHVYLHQDDLNGLDQLYVHNNLINISTISPTTISTSTTTNFKLPSWVESDMSNSILEKCERVPKCVTHIRGEYYVFDDMNYWRYRNWNMTDLIEKKRLGSGLWPELCKVVSASTFRNKIIFTDKHLWYEYNDTKLNKVNIMKNKYNALFEENNTLYGVVNKIDLYVIRKNKAIRVGKIGDKFIGVRKVDWVVVSDKVVSAGIGRGKWTFNKTITSFARLGNVYRVVGSVQPLIESC